MLQGAKNNKVINDLIFKTVMTSSENRDFLEYILEKLLDIKEGELKDKLNVIYEGGIKSNSPKGKQVRGDILITYDNVKLNLEGYSYLDKESIHKSTYYVKGISSSLERGGKYGKDNVIQINIVDNVKKGLLPDKVRSKYLILEEETLMLLDENFKIYYYRIDKAKKEKKRRYNN